MTYLSRENDGKKCNNELLKSMVIFLSTQYLTLSAPSRFSAENGVLRKLKHIFPNTYQRIKSICSPAKGGTGCYRFNYQPGS